MNAKDKLEGSLMFVRFSASAWPAKVRDKVIQAETEEKAGAAHNTHRVWRHLCAPEMKPIHSLILCTRNRIYSRSDTIGTLVGIGEKENWRVMPSLTFDSETPLLRNDIQRINEMVTGLCETNAWESAIERDMKAQGSNANRSNYPDLGKLKSTFSLSFKHRPFTVAATMFGDLFDEAELDVNAQAEMIAENMLKNNIERIKSPLIQLINGMENHGKPNPKTGRASYFKDVTCTQIDELLDVMKGFNVTDNERIDEILSDIQNKLSDLSPDELRKDTIRAVAARRETADDAKQIVSKMEQYF